MKYTKQIIKIHKKLTDLYYLDLLRNDFFYKVLLSLKNVINSKSLFICWKAHHNIYMYKIDKNNKYSISLIKNFKTNTKQHKTFSIKINNKIKGKLGIEVKEFDSTFKKFLKEVTQVLSFTLDVTRTRSDLNERVKEISCLYEISKLMEDNEIDFEIIINKILTLIPPAFQYPKIAYAKIIIDNKTYLSKSFKPSPFSLKANIFINKIKRGYIQVTYDKESFNTKSKVFLQEEQSLINTIAQQISIIIQKHESLIEKKDLERQLMHADRLATIGQLSAGVAHELNEPLNIILGFAQLINKDKNLAVQTKTDIEKITRAALHGREVIKKLMLFAKQIPTEKTSRVNLNNIIKEDYEFLNNRCKKENIALICNLDEKLPRIKADKSKLHQVFINLVVNSIQAIKIRGKINVRTYYDKTNVYLNISDNGTGIEKKIIDKIFLPFFTTKKINEGTGIGLSVVHGIVSSHNGKIKVSSNKVKTTFEVSIPIKN